MDIDLDFQTSFNPLDYFDEAVRASMIKDKVLSKHPAGAYFQNIAIDPITGLAAIPYKEAEDADYFKVDFLHLSLLNYFESKEEIRKLIKTEPDWMLLKSAVHVQKLSHIHRYYDLVSRINPKSVIELADTISLIRPAKRYLLDAYLKNKELVRAEIYRKPDDGQYYFKKGHAVAYSLNIVLQMHLIAGKVL